MSIALNPISGIDGPQKSLNAANATGAGSVVSFSRPRRNFSMQVSFTGGSPTVKVNLQGTIDGSNWFTITSFDTGAGGANNGIVSAVDVVVLAARANLETLSGGTGPTVTATILPTPYQ